MSSQSGSVLTNLQVKEIIPEAGTALRVHVIKPPTPELLEETEMESGAQVVFTFIPPPNQFETAYGPENPDAHCAFKLVAEPRQTEDGVAVTLAATGTELSTTVALPWAPQHPAA